MIRLLKFIFCETCFSAVLIHCLLFFFESPALSLSISGSLKSGKFCAGYSDTVIFKNDVIYRNNPLPFITGIWFPINQIDSSDQMVFGDFFRDNQMNSTLSPSIGLMVNNLQKLVSGYKMEPDFFIHYKEASKKKMDLALKIIGIQTNSFRSKLPVKEKFPCIVYHHGSGSNPFENYELFELLAQHGYVVISASYMLADSTNQKLVSNHTSQESYAGDIQFITSFVKSISCVDTSKMLLMGHSWGAQAALEFDYFDSIKPYQAIISLQTTLEEVSVSEASGWKYLDFIYQNRSSNCTTPAFLITSVSLRKRKAENSNGFEYRNVQPEYLPFRENKTTPYTFITIGKVLYHHQFVSAGHMRYKIALENGYEDINELKEQYQLYQNLNQTILFLCEQILKGSNSDISDFFREKEFSIEFVNQ